MKQIRARIVQRQQEFAQIPLFAFLRDDSISPRERLQFAPYIAFFVMGFGDFNKYLLRDMQSKDPWQKALNEHSLEDDHHWLWYLDDLNRLGHTNSQSLSDSLRFLWSDTTSEGRMFMYRLCGIVYGADPLLKLALTQAIEGTGAVFFNAVEPVARKFTEITGTNLVYFGRFHLGRESGHLMANGSALEAVDALELPETIRRAALEAVDVVFDAAIAFNEEVWANLQRDRCAMTSLSATPA